MIYLTDATVEAACDTLRKAIEAAENSNQAGESFVVAAADAMTLAGLVDRASLAFNRCDYNGTDAEIDAQEAELDEARAALRAYFVRQGLTDKQMHELGWLL